MKDGPILALDLATTMGWAHGLPGEKCRHGSVRLAPPNATHGQIGAGLLTWLNDFCKVSGRPAVIVYESPLNPFAMRGKTNFGTARILVSLPFVAETAAQLLGIETEEVGVQSVRSHFVGGRIPKGEGKKLVARQCYLLGYEPKDDNAADAIALWDYTAAIRHLSKKGAA